LTPPHARIGDTKGTGDGEDPLYISDVVVGDEVVATGQGSSRREAERVAAELALEVLKVRFSEPDARARKRAGRDRRSRNGNAEERAPLIPELLVESLRVAHERLPQGLKGPEATEQVVRLAGEIYRGLIEEAGLVS